MFQTMFMSFNFITLACSSSKTCQFLLFYGVSTYCPAHAASVAVAANSPVLEGDIDLKYKML
jgi:hypothetical protein